MNRIKRRKTRHGLLSFPDIVLPNTTTLDAMKLLFLALAVCLSSFAHAGRRYIAIPIDGLDVIEMRPATSAVAAPPTQRYARHTAEAYIVPVTPEEVQRGEIEAQRVERSSASQILDYVDFGGHTGSNGAFSWFADFPAQH